MVELNTDGRDLHSSGREVDVMKANRIRSRDPTQ